MSDNEKDFGEFPSEHTLERKESVIGWRISRRVDICNVQCKWNHTKKFHHFMLCQDLGSNTRSVFEERKRGPVVKNRLVWKQKCAKAFFNRPEGKGTEEFQNLDFQLLKHVKSRKKPCLGI